MASAFDPSRFIVAEDARVSQGVATLASDFPWPATLGKALENQDLSTHQAPTLATIAALAAPQSETLPWDQELRRFIDGPRPASVAAALWDELIEEAWDVHRQWASQASTAGWDVLDLFGCNPDPTAGRLDRNGLVAAIVSLKTPVRITAIDDRVATLQPRTGPPMRYHRSPAPGSVPLWAAYIKPDPP